MSPQSEKAGKGSLPCLSLLLAAYVRMKPLSIFPDSTGSMQCCLAPRRGSTSRKRCVCFNTWALLYQLKGTTVVKMVRGRFGASDGRIRVSGVPVTQSPVADVL